MRARIWSKREVLLLKSNANYMTISELCIFFDRTPWSIKSKYRKLGIDRSKFTRHIPEDIKTPEPSFDYAYFLGALAADGWSERGSIKLSTIDKPFAYKWAGLGKSLFGIIPTVRIRDRHIKNHKKQYEVMFSSIILSERLGNFKESAWFNNHNLNFINNKEYSAGFLSGYIDGDGHITNRSINIASRNVVAKTKIAEMISFFGNDFSILEDIVYIKKGMLRTIGENLSLAIIRKRNSLAVAMA